MDKDKLVERYRRNGTHEWKQRANIYEHSRYSVPTGSRERRRCHCGCKRRATHRCMANGLAMGSGCEFWVARWVRDPAAALAALRSHAPK